MTPYLVLGGIFLVAVTVIALACVCTSAFEPVGVA